LHRRENILFGLDLENGTGVEIGALDKPVLQRPSANVVYVDHTDRLKLLEKYKDDEAVALTDIVDVDYVWTDGEFAAVLESRKFDFVVASHVIEHVPDVVWWLNEVATVLHPFGSLRLAIPDKRFTFDFLRAETTLSDVLSSWVVGQRCPSPRQIIDFWGYYRAVDALDAWRGDYPKDRRFHSSEFAAALEKAKDAVEFGAYYDTHCLVLTPGSFVTLMQGLVDLDMSEFACTRITTTGFGELEFFVHLMKTDDREARIDSWRWAEWTIATASQKMVAASNFGELAPAWRRIATLFNRVTRAFIFRYRDPASLIRRK
jgi:ubiquinone/menaquinone biosynthesis C-methylase UbiE